MTFVFIANLSHDAANPSPSAARSVGRHLQLFETVVNTRVFAETLNFRGGQKTFGQILIIGQADRAVTLSWQQARLWWGLTGFSSVFNWRPPLVAADTVLALPALRVFAPAYIIVFEGVIFPAIFTFATIAEHIL